MRAREGPRSLAAKRWTAVQINKSERSAPAHAHRLCHGCWQQGTCPAGVLPRVACTFARGDARYAHRSWQSLYGSQPPRGSIPATRGTSSARSEHVQRSCRVHHELRSRERGLPAAGTALLPRRGAAKNHDQRTPQKGAAPRVIKRMNARSGRGTLRSCRPFIAKDHIVSTLRVTTWASLPRSCGSGAVEREILAIPSSARVQPRVLGAGAATDRRYTRKCGAKTAPRLA